MVSPGALHLGLETMIKCLTLKKVDGSVDCRKLSDYFEKGCKFIKDPDNMESLFRGTTSYGPEASNSASSTVKPNWFSPFKNAIVSFLTN